MAAEVREREGHGEYNTRDLQYGDGPSVCELLARLQHQATSVRLWIVQGVLGIVHVLRAGVVITHLAPRALTPGAILPVPIRIRVAGLGVDWVVKDLPGRELGLLGWVRLRA